MDYLVAERDRYDERSAIDNRTHWRRRDRADVADRAVEGVEEERAGIGRVVQDHRAIARRSLGRAHETCERLNVLAVSLLASGVFGISHRIGERDAAAQRRLLAREERAGDAHLK